MTDRSTTRLKIVLLTALVVVTTGMAAPVRQAVGPLLAHPFGSLFGHSPTGPNSLAEQQPSSRPELVAALDESLLGGDPLEHSRESRRSFSERREHDHYVASHAWPAGGTRQFETFVGIEGSRSGGWGRFGPAGGYGPAGGGGAGAAGASPRRHNEQPGTQSSRNDPDPGSSFGKPGRDGGSGGDRGDNDRGRGSNGSDDHDGHSDGVFEKHKDGLDELAGAGENAPLDAGFGLGNVAVNPEPSTLLLFGTGILAAAGALRRRLR
jgi:hypothetical protein